MDWFNSLKCYNNESSDERGPTEEFLAESSPIQDSILSSSLWNYNYEKCKESSNYLLEVIIGFYILFLSLFNEYYCY